MDRTTYANQELFNQYRKGFNDDKQIGQRSALMIETLKARLREATLKFSHEWYSHWDEVVEDLKVLDLDRMLLRHRSNSPEPMAFR